MTYVRGWASAFLIRRRMRIASHAERSPFVAACVMWGEARVFRAVLDAEPPSRTNGLWLPAWRAESRQAPFLHSLTTRSKMQKVYGSYDDFRRNLNGWNACPPPEYTAVIEPAESHDPAPAEQTGRITVNRWGYVTHINGRPLFRRQRS
ncbi:MAG: hypothetical protein FD149_592 [Rhodospirillaceae bacterium]|nr:MAG: hypothetical protein FD149_592 [Rhodospirillaceae bacterium]